MKGTILDSGKRERLCAAGKIIFILYIAFIIYFLLFSEWYGRSSSMQTYHYNLRLFKEIRRFWKYREQLGAYAVFTNLFGNILVFVPFGFFMPMASRRRSGFSALFYSFGLSLCVETFQLLAKVGSFDVDDLLLNTVGGVLGYMVFVIGAAVRRKYDKRKNKGSY